MDSCESGIAPTAAEEVDSFWVGGAFEGAEEVVADTAGFKGAGWLKMVELEEDSASTV